MKTVKCQWYDGGEKCDGMTKLICSFHTDMGTANGVEKNDFNNTYECEKCKRKFIEFCSYNKID